MNKVLQFIVVSMILMIVVGCAGDNTSNNSQVVNQADIEAIDRPDTKFKTLRSDATGITADNKLEETKSFNHFLWASIYNGSGVGVADFNNDGKTDIYVGQNMTADHLYINEGNMTFDNVSQAALPADNRWTSGVSVVDINLDGWMDIYVCKFGPSMNPTDRKNQLLVNQKDGTFLDKAKDYGLDDNGFTTQTAFFDVDKDGDLDAYVVNQPPDSRFLQRKEPSAQEIKELYSDRLYIRNNSGRYIDKTEAYGVQNYASGLNVLVNDINEDGWLDLYISNDYEKPDYIYINQGGKKFVDELESRTGHISNFAMGSDVADINNDGLNDLAILDMSSSDHYRSKTNMGAMNEAEFWANVDKGNHYQYMFNTLQLNQGDGHYSEIAQMAGIAQTDWSWSILFEDFNMDGSKDVYVTNGIKKDIRNNDFIQSLKNKINSGTKKFQSMDLVNKVPSNPISNYYYQSNGGITYTDATKSAGAYEPNFSTGCGVADFDGDGDLDIFASVSEAPSVILSNETSSSSTVYRYNIAHEDYVSMMNAKLVLKTNCGVYRKDVVPSRGYLSSSYGEIHIAVPAGCEVSSAEISTIYGKTYILPLEKSKITELTSSSLEEKSSGSTKSNNKLFAASNALKLSHKENTYNDYDVEKLLPHKLSEDGPCSVVADFDGDGVSELLVGGSLGIPAQLMRYRENTWQLSNKPFWSSIAANENHHMNAFDADSDGDLDLYISNGGNESIEDGNDWSIDQLLINDGAGNFTLDTKLPKIGINTTASVAIDIDGDNDQDLLVLAGHKIGQYPSSHDSYVLENKDGVFAINKELADGLSNLGLVSDAVVMDYNGDDIEDVVTVGPWSIPHVLVGNGSKLRLDSPAELESLSSWWTSISKGDFDGDGREDLVLGSFGDNNKFHPSKKKPLEIFGTDFDGSGSNDIVLAKHYNNKVVPTRGRECSSQQIPNIQEKFPTFDQFALAGIEDILGEENLEKSAHAKITGMSHYILWNKNSGWESSRLPEMCQISPLKSTAVVDVNGDGLQDIIGIGNHYGAEVETARYDAGYGWVLLGNSDRRPKYISAKEAGLWLNGDGRSVEVAETKSGKQLIALFNNDKAKAFDLRN